MEEKDKQLLKSVLELAFMAGRWRGQVDLEEDMDNNCFDACLSSIHSTKSGGACIHSVAMDNDNPNSKPVKYNLRSDEWKEGVKKTTKEHLDDAYNMFINNF